MTKTQTLSQPKTPHWCFLCESKSLQPFYISERSWAVISHSPTEHVVLFCHLVPLICWDGLLTIAQPAGSHQGLVLELVSHRAAESLGLSSQ